MKRIALLLITVALLASALPAVAQDNAPLEYGASGDRVLEIQQRLTDLGYYTGKVSGNFLEGTRYAVKRFQKDYGVEVTGVVDGETEAMLFGAEYRHLTYGMSGDDVLRVQEQLNALGYYNGKQSGDYLEGTTAGIEAFQTINELPVTGDADADTQRALFSDGARAKDYVPPTVAPEGESADDLGDINDVVMVEDGAASSDASETAEVPFPGKLTRGTSNRSVKRVQERLIELGFFEGPVSGNYQSKTVEAVKEFQAHNSLKADGVTGKETWNMLFNNAYVLSARETPYPTPEPTPVPYAVTVDVRNQVVIVYGLDDEGGYTNIVRQMICSTGMVGSPSDVGVWITNGRRARWAYFSLYGSHAQFWTRINENIAFHSVIYNAVDYSALSVKSYNKLGQRASHGCIRLLVADAEWVYENIREGTAITITEELPVDQELHMALMPPALNKTYMRPVTTPEPTATPAYTSTGMPSEPFRTLQIKSTGEDVFWLQMRLKELGYYTGTVTGTYYSGTQKAVKAYQKDHGIYADGKAGVKTLNSLYAEALAAEALAAVTPAPTESPASSESPAPSGTPAPTDTLAPTGTPAPTD